MNDVTRRRFLALTGGAGLALVGCSGSIGRPSDSGAFSGLAPAPEDHTASSPTTVPTSPVSPGPEPARVLVVVQMGGGNDGLNTLVPADGRYRDARPTLAIPEANLVGLAGTEAGLHPSLQPLADFWHRGDMAAMQAIGIPDQSRSHFVALDTWWAGAPASSSAGGWLGRWLDATTAPDPSAIRAVALAGGAPALTGRTGSPAVLQSLDGLDLRDRSGAGMVTAAFADMGGGGVGLAGRARAAIPAAMETSEALGAAIERSSGSGLESLGGTEMLFSAAAEIISADLGVEAMVINLGGYDTHANQLGTHALLLRRMADGLALMFDRLAQRGDDGRVLAITFSEFGRRVVENGSAGTDHGHGGLAFLLGPGVEGGRIVGDLHLGDLVHGDVPIDVDARSLYANGLNWLGGPVEEVLGGSWDTFGFT